MINVKNKMLLLSKVFGGTNGELIIEIEKKISCNSKVTIACLNPHSQVVAWSNCEFHNALFSVNYLLPDGIGIILASIILKLGISSRIPGPDFFENISEHFDNKNNVLSYYFLGSSTSVLDSIVENVGKRWKNIKIVGAYSPPFIKELSFPDDENDRMIDNINGKNVDILWIGMTAPKQELWMAKYASRLNVRMIVCIGAAFDFFSGNKKRSNELFRTFGLEWLHRLIMEPRRMFRRNLYSTPIFLLNVITIGIFRTFSGRNSCKGNVR